MMKTALATIALALCTQQAQAQDGGECPEEISSETAAQVKFATPASWLSWV
eukprot:SAG22_NODE_20027_length_269_cov_0.676471_1_plen_50_part_10